MADLVGGATPARDDLPQDESFHEDLIRQRDMARGRLEDRRVDADRWERVVVACDAALQAMDSHAKQSQQMREELERSRVGSERIERVS